ncbi:LacI family DNA-binding transcriptional regulator [Profundibacter sp.]
MPPNRPTIKDVAKMAAVSVGTASRVINGNSTVKPKTRARVKEAISKLNYQPNPVAQSMRTGATRTIGCILRNLKTPVMADFIKGAEEIISPAGYALMLANNYDSPQAERAVIQTFSKRFVDGLLLTVCDEEDAQILDFLKELNIPVVLLDRQLGTEFDSVIVDHSSGLVQATDYLLGLGHRRIALLAGNPVVHPSRDSIVGFIKAHEAAGLAWDPDLLICSDFWEKTAYEKTCALLALDTPPTAIISGGTMMLPGVLRAIRKVGLAIPKDISLITGYDSELAQLVSPSITAIHKDFSTVGTLGAELLLKRLNRTMTDGPCSILVPSSFVERESCSKPKAS